MGLSHGEGSYTVTNLPARVMKASVQGGGDSESGDYPSVCVNRTEADRI